MVYTKGASPSGPITWPQIVKKYGYDAVLETHYHGTTHDGRPEKHELFHCSAAGGGSEFEVTNFLNALVKLFKFENILETGCEQGHGTLALAEAVQYNGIGHVTTVDNCDIAAVKGPTKLYECRLGQHVTYVKQDSVSFAEEYDGPPFDFAFFDCGFPARIDCFWKLYRRDKLSRIVSFHDVAHHQRLKDRQTEEYCASLDGIAKRIGQAHVHSGGLFNVLSRGFRMFQLEL